MKHTGGTCLRMSLVFIGLVKESSLDPLSEVDYMIRPLFCTMKCLDPITRSAKDKCMVFVDEFGWVYKNWKAFTEETLYPATQIVCPLNGVFMRSDDGRVKLYYFKAPMTSKQIERKRWSELSMSVGSLGSACVLAASVTYPIAAPYIIGAVGVGTTIGLLCGATSVKRLFHRAGHEQSISVYDKDSRAHWLTITGTFVGFLASGASSALRSAATAGKVSNALVTASTTLFRSSVFINGVSIGNSVWNVWQEDQEPSAGHILHLSASLFLFTHSIYNFQTAETMVQETQKQHLSDYKQTLGWFGKLRFQRKLNGKVREVGVESRATNDFIRDLNTTNHYNTKFRPTEATTNIAGNQNLCENLAIAFNRFAPESWAKLAVITSVIMKSVGEEKYELFKKMAELIMDRLGNGGRLTIDWVLNKCYDLVIDYARMRNIGVDDVLMSFNGQSFATIPWFVQQWFHVLVAVPGEVICEDCGGQKYLN